MTQKKALIIGIDGCRPDALKAATTPALDSLIAKGAYSFEAQTCALTKSGPSWASVLTGVWPDSHRTVNNSMTDARFDLYPHFFQRLKERNPTASTASIVHWGPINERIVAAADVSSIHETDAEVADEAVRLLQYSDPDVLFLHFDEVDGSGHRNGYSPDVQAYLDSIATVDGLIDAVLVALIQRASYDLEDWLIVATTDHGGSPRVLPGEAKARHGDDVPEHRTIFVILAGRQVAHGTIELAPVVVDIAPTILRYLGVEIDPGWGWLGNAIGLG